jgi:GT2 family glycosyltransferase
VSDHASPSPVLPGNRWDLVRVPTAGAWTPTERVSVVVPHFQAVAALERTLASLAAQTYPGEHTEVVVVDDGSDPPLELPGPDGTPWEGLTVRVLHQEDRGFGLARARHTGALAASGTILVFLDADMLCEPGHLEAHARWHHRCELAVTLGERRHVAIDPDDADLLTPQAVADAGRSGGLAPLFAGRPHRRPAWIDRHLARTADLTGDDDDLFRVTAGGNLGVRRALYLDVGGFDPSFEQWGSEDTDLGHRLFLAGALLVPEPGAACWHQGDHGGLEPHERRSLEQQQARLSQTIAHPHFRRMMPGRTFEVPWLVLDLDVGSAPRDAVLATLEDVLASDISDLDVVLHLPGDHPDHLRLTREVAGDARVHLAARPAHRWSPYRVTLPAGVRLTTGALRAAVAATGTSRIDHGVVEVDVPGAQPGAVRVLVTRALARARASGVSEDRVLAAAATAFGRSEVAGGDLGLVWQPQTDLPRLRTIPTPAAPQATSGPSAQPSRLAAWQLLDDPVGWRDRGRAADAIRAAQERAAAAEQAAASARADARRTREQLDRVRARRVLRVTDELGATGRREPVRTLPGRLRSALAPSEGSPATTPPAGAPARTSSADPDPTTRSSPDTDEARTAPTGRAAPAEAVSPGADRGGDRDADRDAIPHLRILHLGVVTRFGTLAHHDVLTAPAWREQLRAGADLVLLEPPPDEPGWDPLAGELPALLAAAHELGIPTVRIHPDQRDHAAPGRAGAELVETTRDVADRLPPSIDHTAFHPRGWTPTPPDAVSVLLRRQPGSRARALLDGLDPPAVVLHPADLVPDRVGRHQRALAGPERVGRQLRRTGLLLDHAGWRLGGDDRWRSWLAALACGTPVVTVDEDLPAADTLPPGVLAVPEGGVVDTVHGLLTDGDLRERHSIQARRWAHTRADRRTALEAVLAAAGLPAPPPRTTTVLLATHRADHLDHALASIARQTQPELSVSMVLHGPGFDGLDVSTRLLRSAGVEVAAVQRLGADRTLGDCLNAALARAPGTLVSKMDDDDHYGPHHLEDLVVAWRHSGADVVGKRIEFIHLVDRDLTLRRTPSRPERDRPHVGGPTLTAARSTLQRFGFLRLPRRVDSTLYERVLAAGGRIYGTHSRDVVLTRHGAGHGHAWQVEAEELLADAITTAPGLDIAGASSDPADRG